MSEFELLEVLRNANASLDSNFQFWLSSTFAVLMAFFFAGERIVGYIKWVIVLLFLSSTMVFLYRMQASGREATKARRALEELDSDFLIINADTSAIVIGGGFMTIILIGTIATVYYCLNSRKITGK